MFYNQTLQSPVPPAAAAPGRAGAQVSISASRSSNRCVFMLLIATLHLGFSAQKTVLMKCFITAKRPAKLDMIVKMDMPFNKYYALLSVMKTKRKKEILLHPKGS